MAVDRETLRIPISGVLSSGQTHQSHVLIPQTFTYLLMKLCAFRDRMDDSDKAFGQHHALDIYRLVGLLTREEDAAVRKLSAEFSSHSVVLDARAIAQAHFIAADGVGRLRILEHPLYSPSLDLERLASELGGLL